MNCGFSLRALTEPLIVLIPNMSMAKPSRIFPRCMFCSFLENILRTMPATETMPVSVEVERSETQPAPSSRPERQIIQPVILVPSIAPSTIPIACLSFIIPEFTKPTTITEVADDDCMTAVTPVPRSTPFNGVLVSLYNNISRLFPATILRPSPIRAIPNRNSATPLRSEMKCDTSIIVITSLCLS